jgi:hypothetical protein
MNLPYPRGAARAIAESRANGLKPAETVLIVLAGTFDWPNPQVYLNPHQAYRWDWLRGLHAVALIDSKIRLGNTLQDIDRAEPSQLDVIDIERRCGWMVLTTRPRIRTIRWPVAWVADWLGPCIWHQDLNRIKADSRRFAAHCQTPTFEPEPVWN